MQYIREDEASMRISVYDPKAPLVPIPVPGPKVDWATYAGGALEATTVKVRPGGMGQQVDIGGPATRADVTMTIQMRDDIATIHDALEGYVGVARASCYVQYLNPDGSSITGAQFTRVGTLKSVELPEANSDGTAIGFYTLVISCDEVAT